MAKKKPKQKKIKNEKRKVYLNANMVLSNGIFWDIPALICGPLNMLPPSSVPLFVVKKHPKILSPTEGK